MKAKKTAIQSMFSNDGTKYNGPYEALCGCVWSGNGSMPVPYQFKKCQLHAAAPNLLAALKAVHDVLLMDRKGKYSRAISLANAAITDAEVHKTSTAQNLHFPTEHMICYNTRSPCRQDGLNCSGCGTWCCAWHMYCGKDELQYCWPCVSKLRTTVEAR